MHPRRSTRSWPPPSTGAQDQGAGDVVALALEGSNSDVLVVRTDRVPTSA
ncbi:MAG: hypothetical protein M3063_03060 [Actinomycetota bacterium]|nr:hypothetical protein [Actinomycetota bacterium]